MVAWGEGWNHDVRHVDLLRAKKHWLSPGGPNQPPGCGQPWTQRVGPGREGSFQKDPSDPTPAPPPLSAPSDPSWEEGILGPALDMGTKTREGAEQTWASLLEAMPEWFCFIHSRFLSPFTARLHPGVHPATSSSPRAQPSPLLPGSAAEGG